MYLSSGEGGEAAEQGMAAMFGPTQVDQTIRHAIQFCWMALLKERRNADELERQIRRILDRARKIFGKIAKRLAAPHDCHDELVNCGAWKRISRILERDPCRFRVGVIRHPCLSSEMELLRGLFGCSDGFAGSR